MAMNRRALPLVLLVVSACPSFAPEARDQLDFEACTAPCGLTASGTGQADLVATIHPGEHGLRLAGDITVRRVLDPGAEGTSLEWLQDGPVEVAIERDDPDAAAPMFLAGTLLDPSDATAEAAGGFHRVGIEMGSATPVGVRAYSFHHLASDPPTTIDVVRLLVGNNSPGCY